jgi:hypothetical protein
MYEPYLNDVQAANLSSDMNGTTLEAEAAVSLVIYLMCFMCSLIMTHLLLWTKYHCIVRPI